METKVKTENKGATSLIESMFGVGAHYGYSRSRRHPSFASFIFATKNKSDVIDLEKTGTELSKALDFVKEAVADNKTILFVGTKPEARKIIKEAATALDIPYMTHRWIGGLLTNFAEMKKRIKVLEEWLTKIDRGELEVYTKKERAKIDKEIAELKSDFGGARNMVKVPDVLYVVDPRHEDIAVNEAKKKGVTIVALTGTDCDLTNIAYPIPANDSNIKSIEFFTNKISEAYKEGLKNKKPEPSIEKKDDK